MINRLLCLGPVGVVLACVGPPTFAASTPVTVGETTLAIPAPEGFVEIGRDLPVLRELSLDLVPPTNRMLGIFAAEGDLALAKAGGEAEYRRYMYLQSVKNLESLSVSLDDFSQLAEAMRTQQEEYLAKAKPGTDQVLDRAGKRLADTYDSNFSLEVGEIKALGTFLDQPRAFGLTVMSKVHGAAGAERFARTMANATMAMLVGDKLVFAYVYSTFDTPEDLEWLHITAKGWAASILAANATIPAGEASGGGDSIWARALERGAMAAIPGAIIGGVIGLLFAVFRRKKKS